MMLTYSDDWFNSWKLEIYKRVYGREYFWPILDFSYVECFPVFLSNPNSVQTHVKTLSSTPVRQDATRASVHKQVLTEHV